MEKDWTGFNLGFAGYFATPSLRTQEQCKFKVEVDVLGSPSLIYCLYGLCGRKATLNLNFTLLNVELRSCVSVEVDVLGSLCP